MVTRRGVLGARAGLALPLPAFGQGDFDKLYDVWIKRARDFGPARLIDQTS